MKEIRTGPAHLSGEPARRCFQFRMLALRDYEGARCLLLNGLYLQGATLASTAVEKYLKCVLCSYRVGSKFHLDQLSRVRKIFTKHKIALFSELDPAFLGILSKAYRFRYYDNLRNEVFGFLYWQFLGELDYTVNLIEGRIRIQTPPAPFRDSYKEAMEDADGGDSLIRRDNYIALAINKQEFMERRGPGIIVKITDDGVEQQVRATDGLAVKCYDGEIATATDVRVRSARVSSEGPG